MKDAIMSRTQRDLSKYNNGLVNRGNITLFVIQDLARC